MPATEKLPDFEKGNLTGMIDVLEEKSLSAGKAAL